MKLPAQPVRSHQDATLNFDKLQRQVAAQWKPVELLGFEHAWKNFEAGRKGEYRRVFDIVELRGVLASGESAKTAFVLPEGHRPKEAKDFLVNANGNTGLVAVTSAGGVEPVNVAGEVKVYVFLDPVRFSVS